MRSETPVLRPQAIVYLDRVRIRVRVRPRSCSSSRVRIRVECNYTNRGVYLVTVGVCARLGFVIINKLAFLISTVCISLSLSLSHTYNEYLLPAVGSSQILSCGNMHLSRYSYLNRE